MRRGCDIVIGIDPDCEKSGYAVAEARRDGRRDRVTEVACLRFPDLLERIRGRWNEAQRQGRRCDIILEAGWLNKGNWHVAVTDSRQAAAAKGLHVGRNHETGRKIAEMLRYWGISVTEQKPYPKVWKNGKISHEEIVRQTGWQRRTNQEERDAVLMAWLWSDATMMI